jgi:hypothetical protein
LIEPIFHKEGREPRLSDLFALQELKNEGRVDVIITDLGIGMDAINSSKLPAIPVGEALFMDECGIPQKLLQTSSLKMRNSDVAHFFITLSENRVHALGRCFLSFVQ